MLILKISLIVLICLPLLALSIFMIGKLADEIIRGSKDNNKNVKTDSQRYAENEIEASRKRRKTRRRK